MKSLKLLNFTCQNTVANVIAASEIPICPTAFMNIILFLIRASSAVAAPAFTNIPIPMSYVPNRG